MVFSSHIQLVFFACSSFVKLEKSLQESRLPCFALCLGGKFAIMLQIVYMGITLDCFQNQSLVILVCLNQTFDVKGNISLNLSIIHAYDVNMKSKCSLGPNESTTPLRQWSFRQCLSFSWTTLRGKHFRKLHCRNGVVDMFGPKLHLLFMLTS